MNDGVLSLLSWKKRGMRLRKGRAISQRVEETSDVSSMGMKVPCHGERGVISALRAMRIARY